MKQIATPHFDFESKKEYKKPAMQVVLLQHKCQLLTGSNDPQGVPYWGGEGD